MSQWLAPAHLALTLVIIVWNVVLAGHIVQLRQATKPFAILTGLAGMLLIPAFVVAVATTTVITGRAISAIDWLWPLTVAMFAAQSVYALTRRIVNPLVGYPIAFYNVLLAVALAARYSTAHGYDLAHPLLMLMAAEIDALALVTTEAAISSPLFLHVPFIAPAFEAQRRLGAAVRVAMAVVALAWFGVIVAEIPRANIALASYARHGDDRLRERPDGFRVGAKLFPDVSGLPSAGSVSMDLQLAESLGVNVVSVTFVPGASIVAIDSAARAIDLMERDSIVVIATIGYRGTLLPEVIREPLDADLRLRTLHNVLMRLQPDIVLPAQDPYGLGARVVGRLPVEDWQRYLTRAAELVEAVRPRVQVAVAASVYDSRDSALYAWAAAPGSPMEAVGFTFYPNRLGARTMDASFRAADRWMQAHPPGKPHWVFGVGGYPLAHGERSQDRAIWATLAWATDHQAVQGLVITEGNDYGQSMGLRAPNGRFRLAAASVSRAIRDIRESTTRPPIAPTMHPPQEP
ncbi:MAG: hypothetical protein WD801_12865 [Gemmatimonadaceae bacterium]